MTVDPATDAAAFDDESADTASSVSETGDDDTAGERDVERDDDVTGDGGEPGIWGRTTAMRTAETRSGSDAEFASDDTTGIDEVMVADERARWLTRFGIVALIAAGPFYTFSFAYFSNADFPAQARFALPLVVFMVVGLAAALTTRWAMAIASTIVVLASANLLWLLLTP